MTQPNAPQFSLVCGFCKRPPEQHADSDAGPMTVCYPYCPTSIDGHPHGCRCR